MSTDTATTMPFMIKWSMRSWDICVDAVFYLWTRKAFDILFVGVNQDSVVLTDTELATPLAVAKRYYGTDVNPVDGIITTGSLQQWWIAMRNYIWQQRKDGSMTPTGAFVALGKYMDSCMESHRWVDVRCVCVWIGLLADHWPVLSGVWCYLVPTGARGSSSLWTSWTGVFVLVVWFGGG